MKNKKILKQLLNGNISFIFFSFLLLSCSLSKSSEASLKQNVQQEKHGINERNRVADDTATYIVKTVRNFDTSLLENEGALLAKNEPVTNLLIDGEFHTIKRSYAKNEDIFLKSIASLEGIYYIEKNEKIEKPKFTNTEHAPNTLLRQLSLQDGNLKEDPEGMYYDYALRVTHARDFVDADGNKQQGAYTKVGYGKNMAVLAIIDSGLNMRHPDFKLPDGSSRCLYAKSYYQAGAAQESKLYEVAIGANEDDIGHGTHCSGTMCAVEGNGEGIAGVAHKNTYLISYRSLAAKGGSAYAVYGALGDLAETVSILRKEVKDRTAEEKRKIPKSVPQDFVIRQKTVPVNMSIGSHSTGDFEIEMINLALKHNVLPIVAMGNDGRLQPEYPRSVHGCIAVGATNAKDKRAVFSDAGEWMSVCAPGSDIISATSGEWASEGVKPGSDTKGTRFMSGTSMAAPFVTGLIGYLLSFDAGQKLSPYQIKKLLEESADKIDSESHFGNYVAGRSLYYGFGRVNVLKAASAVAGKEGALSIPETNSFYLDSPITILTPYPSIKVRLYEVLPNGQLIPQGLSLTDRKRTTYFYGLKKGTKYKITCDIYGKEKEHDFVATDATEMKHEFTVI